MRYQHDFSTALVKCLTSRMSEDFDDSCTYFSMIRGYHIYKEVWTATLGEQLQCRRETSNPCDLYAIAVVNNEDFIVGHVPRSVSTLCSLFYSEAEILCVK